MVTGIIGRKVGMTQVFETDGTVVPATVIKAGPCVVVQAKTAQTDGYEAVQLGLVDDAAAEGQQADGRPLQEGQRAADARAPRSEGGAGRRRARRPAIRCSASIFNAGDRVDVIGTSRGKGFQGVMKRHHFAGGAATHGSMFHRAPGSIGASSFPSRVVKGMRAAGRMGGDRVTTRNLKVVSVDAEQPPAGAARRGAGRAGRRRDRPARRGAQAGSAAAGREEEGQEVAHR